MKLLYILPHCSTGGMPQYVVKMVQEFSKENDITVVETDNYSDEYVVQRNKLKSLVNFVQLFGDREKLVELVGSGFDAIHFQEIPETFLKDDVLDRIYSTDRTYTIVVTTHSSYTDPRTIRYTADRYVLVSNWSRKVFEDYYKRSVECDIWEYPVDKVEYDKDEAKQLAGFDSNYKHVLHVGLFTPGKNQKELIQVARNCLDKKVKFHFVGNQAGNFEDYWGPLMKQFPPNCVWHGEREDVETFYKAADAFYFPSLFELNPISLKEALSFNVPILIKKLHTYEDYYDGVATYLSDNIKINKFLLLNILGLNDVKPRVQALHLLTVPTHAREKKSIQYISQLQKYGIDYYQIVNEPYDGEPPADFCRRPENIGSKSQYIGNGLGILTGRHYGNFRAHSGAIASIDVSKYDYTLIFEADANLECSAEEFVQIVYKACFLLKDENSPFVSLSDNPSGLKSQYNENFWLTSPNQDLAHCYLVPSSEKQWYLDRIADCPWDGFDVWLNDVFIRYPRKRFTTTRCWSNQIEGLSLIDPVVKWAKDKTHYDYIEIGTSDFDTLLEIYPEGTLGLSIEPIKTYLDRLPDKQGNTKFNAAITDEDCELSVFYVKPEDIEANGLAEWVKGCNSVGAPHPSVVRELTQRELMHIYTQDVIEGVSFPSLIDQSNIGSVDYLKVDTEGHDFVILRSMLKTSLRPNKVRFEANSLYTEEAILSIISDMSEHGYKIIQRTIDDVVMRLEVEEDSLPYTAPTLIISSGRRWQYLKKTLQLLVEKNPDIAQVVKKVWVLDDRSTAGDRVNMSIKLTEIFGDKWNMVSFNSEKPFEFVDKFKMIRRLIEPTDVVFLLEDDWECHDYLHLPYHINRLQKSDWTQIAFADPLEIQSVEIQNLTRLDNMYWKNPWPNGFKHPVRWNGDMCWWFMGTINNYTNNPSLIKGEVFFRAEYINHKDFEASFANRINGNQVFTQEALFRHFGEDSLINQL
jgi:glycosyltransferase involved in cell wall biosynthesis